jgi:hypothetical protein
VFSRRGKWSYYVQRSTYCDRLSELIGLVPSGQSHRHCMGSTLVLQQACCADIINAHSSTVTSLTFIKFFRFCRKSGTRHFVVR